jgi:protoporphyrinogen oxidase
LGGLNSASETEAKTFEDWMVKKFGWKMYNAFFKTYTEKIWGIPCKDIDAQWAVQRIKGLDITTVIKNALFKSKDQVKTLVEVFDYPVLGAGQMYEVMAEKLLKENVQLKLDSRVVNFKHNDNTISSIDVVDKTGSTLTITAKHFFNSIPLTHFFKMLNPSEPDHINRAVEALYYRDHITINMLIDGDHLFNDQWLYIHSPNIKAARVTNYNNFSKAMIGQKNKTALSIEYFAFQHEDLWKKNDDELKELAAYELQELGLGKKDMVEKSWIVRETETSPVYYRDYLKPYQLLKERANQFTNLSPIGRGGMYKYNNQDHSTLSGILAARNYIGKSSVKHDLWEINVEDSYLEDAARP